MSHNYKPVKNWKQRRRAGMVMSRQMFDLLQELRAAKQNDFPFVDCAHIHLKTLNTMILNDWIVRSHGLDGVRYCITGRGIKALEIFEEPPRRFDGICTRCGERPRLVYTTGRQGAYCEECTKYIQNRQYRLRGNQLNPEGTCATEGCDNQRHTYPAGHTIAYCKACRDAMRKDEKKRGRIRLLERIQAGEYVSCLKCDQPRYVSGNTVQDYCYEHFREMQNENWQKRKRRRFEEMIA